MNALRNILVLGHHDVRLFLRDRGSYIWLFVVPLAFTYFLSYAARGPGGPADARPALVLDNRDTGFLGAVFARELGEQGLTLRAPDEAGDAPRGITVPEDFTQRVLARRQVTLEFFTIEGSDMGMAQIVAIRLFRTLLALNTRLARHAIDDPDRAPTEESLIALMESAPSVALDVSHAGHKPRPVGFAFSLPGNLVGYLFLNLLVFGGASVAAGRRGGVLRRLAVSPLTRRELLFGKLYGLILLGGVQTTVFLLVGQFVFGLDLADNLPGILLTLAVFSWVAASVGVMIGFLIKDEEKVVGVCLAIALPMAFLGGCWVPLEFGPDYFRLLSRTVPTGWALDALHQSITFGAGLAQTVPAIGVLVLFGLAANFAAAKCFRV